MEIKNHLNKNLSRIAPSPIRDFDQEVSKIPGIKKLTLGEPDFYTPEHVKDGGVQAIIDNQSHYTMNQGLPKLRQAISKFYQEKYGPYYDPADEILVTIGATEAIATAFQTILESGDQVIVPMPGYPGYGASILLNGGEILELDTSEDDFLVTPEKLDQVLKNAPKVKAIVLNYPANPTGMTYSREQLSELAKVISKYEIFVVADEVYSELTYTAEGHASIAEFLPEQTIVLNGLSKSHAMTGWRIGYILARRELVTEFAKVHQHLVVSASTISQYAAVEALENGKNDAEVMKKDYLRRRDYLVKALKDMGFGVVTPIGAFYIFAKIPDKVSMNSYDFLLDFAQKKGYAFIPGSAFGEGGEGHVRISYASSMEVIEGAMAALKEYLEEL